MLHFHGTPLTPRSSLYLLAGRHFCVSYSSPRDLEPCLTIGQSVMGDSGAFSAHTVGKDMDWMGYLAWLEKWIRPPHWGVIPDVIGGSVEDQRQLHKIWPFPKEYGAVVWHLHLPLEWLAELSDNYPFIAFGSSAQFWKPASESWRRRVDQAWDMLARRHRFTPKVHMLRAMREANKGPWPFNSVDSVTVARDHSARPQRGKVNDQCPGRKAAEMDMKQPPWGPYVGRPKQVELPHDDHHAPVPDRGRVPDERGEGSVSGDDAPAGRPVRDRPRAAGRRDPRVLQGVLV